MQEVPQEAVDSHSVLQQLPLLGKHHYSEVQQVEPLVTSQLQVVVYSAILRINLQQEAVYLEVRQQREVYNPNKSHLYSVTQGKQQAQEEDSSEEVHNQLVNKQQEEQAQDYLASLQEAQEQDCLDSSNQLEQVQAVASSDKVPQEEACLVVPLNNNNQVVVYLGNKTFLHNNQVCNKQQEEAQYKF